MEIEKDPMEPMIKEYLREHGVLSYTIGMNLLTECISFWMDMDINSLFQITHSPSEKQRYNTNLYVDLAIYHDGSIHTVMQYMWDAISTKKGQPLNPMILNYFVIRGILTMQNKLKEAKPTGVAQIIPFPDKKESLDPPKQFVYQNEMRERQ